MTTKYSAELAFWKSRLEINQGVFYNGHYERIMLAMALEPDPDFVLGKVVADFGCGPRGSLVWASAAALRIGIDVLADVYADEFTDNIISHGMIYLKSTEQVIPLPSAMVDILFTMNAIDHVDNFEKMCAEILRVLKPGGTFIGSFNLEEPATSTEPQHLTEKRIKEVLLDYLEVKSYRVSHSGPIDHEYEPFYTESLTYEPGQSGILWVKARKPA
jgi:SAM-dependent methyltransferase